VKTPISIKAFGVYVPAYRLARDVIAKATGGHAGRGEKAVANYDEDALTMGVNASLECLDNYSRIQNLENDPLNISSLLFASSSSPYLEKQAAGVIADVLETDPSGLFTDIHASLRGGLDGIDIGMSLLADGTTAGHVLIVASDKRTGEPGSGEEQAFGDGAASLLLGKGEGLATVEASARLNANFPHFWRRENDSYVHSGDQRFVTNLGYLPLMSGAIDKLLKQTNLSAADISKLVAYAPNPGLLKQLSRKAGFNFETQIADTLFGSIGDTGAPQVFISLANALSKAKAGDNLIIAGYGDGAEAILLKVSARIDQVEKCRSVGAFCARKRMLDSYVKYLNFRNIVGESSYDAFSSLALLWRENRQNMRLYGVKCQHCNTIHFPQRRVCHACGTKDRMDPIKLSRRGTIYTYTNDYLYLNPDPPGSLAAVDLEGGGRFFGQVTDADPKDIKIGQEVELSFRKLHDGQDIPNYFWKAVVPVGR